MTPAEFEPVMTGKRWTLMAHTQVLQLLHHRVPPIRGLAAIVATFERLADAGTLHDRSKYEEYPHPAGKICAVKRRSEGIRIYGWRSTERPRTMWFSLAIDDKNHQRLDRGVLDRLAAHRATIEAALRTAERRS